MIRVQKNRYVKCVFRPTKPFTSTKCGCRADRRRRVAPRIYEVPDAASKRYIVVIAVESW